MKSFVHLALLLRMIAVTLKGAEGHNLRRKQFVGLYEWTDLELAFPTEQHMHDALVHGYYDKSKLVPVDVDMEYGDDGHYRAFITIPRLNVGVPYSLAVVAAGVDAVKRNPMLVPYPSYDWHASQGLNCSGITSAIRTAIDDCWRLWVVDSGQINSVQHCAPQILAFDLVTDKLMHRYTLPTTLYAPGISVFTALAVDVGDAEPKNECRDAMIYIADPWGYGLIVYDMFASKSWRIEHELMQPDKHLQTSNAASDGIFTVSLDSKDASFGGSRRLYFHALNSYTEVAVPLRIVNNASLWLDSQPGRGGKTAARGEFSLIGSRGTQCESETMDSAGNLYCSLISSNALVSWSRSSDYNSDNLKVVAYSPQQLKFVTGLKVNRNAAEEDELWALSNDPRLFVGGRVKTGDVKFQIIGCRTRNLLTNEFCTVQATERNTLLKNH